MDDRVIPKHVAGVIVGISLTRKGDAVVTFLSPPDPRSYHKGIESAPIIETVHLPSHIAKALIKNLLPVFNKDELEEIVSEANKLLNKKEEEQT